MAEAGSDLGGGLRETVAEFHRHGLFLYTWGDANNDCERCRTLCCPALQLRCTAL